MPSSIEQAVEIVGSQARLAALVGVTPQFVHQWCCGKRPVPATLCGRIERATEGQVTRAQLRPDVFGDLVPRPDPYCESCTPGP